MLDDFKLHLFMNELKREIIACKLMGTKAGHHKIIDILTEGFTVKLVVDKRYIKRPLREVLWERHLQLITHIRDIR